MTTGPLDPAVYWRRRALVGVPILILLFVLATCAVKAAGSGDGDSAKTGKDKVATKSQPQPSPSPSPSPVAQVPAAQNPASAPAPCADTDLSVTAALAHQRYPTSSKLPVKVSVTNTSGKACVRDVGAGQQEVLVKGAGDTRIWSSDDCTNDPTSDARTLQPNEKRMYWVTWDSRTSAPGCASTSTGLAQPGAYQVVTRFGTKFSAPINVTLT